MGSLFVQISHDADAGTRAQRGFLVASAAAEAGHAVSVFLAGGAVELLTPEQLDRDAFGVPLRRHVTGLLDAGGTIFLSEAAMASRGFPLERLDVRPLVPASHTKIVELAFSHDRVLTYG